MNREIFEEFIRHKGKIASNKLDEFFASLEPVKAEELIGDWLGGCLPAGSKVEFLLKDFILFKWHGKSFLTLNRVLALIVSFLGIKFNIPGGTAVLRELKFRDKISTSMVYNYLPIIDHFRKVDDNTVMGIMEAKGKVSVYFYLKRC